MVVVGEVEISEVVGGAVVNVEGDEAASVVFVVVDTSLKVGVVVVVSVDVLVSEAYVLWDPGSSHVCMFE